MTLQEDNKASAPRLAIWSASLQVRAERLLGQGSRLGPGVHERGEGLPVGDVDQHPAHPDPDLALLRPDSGLRT